MTRNRLPGRRPSVGFLTEWQGPEFAVSVGIDPASLGGAPHRAFRRAADLRLEDIAAKRPFQFFRRLPGCIGHGQVGEDDAVFLVGHEQRVGHGV